MDDKKSMGFFLGFVSGIVLVVFVWIAVSRVVERSKVANGYLTFDGVRYQVVLYDKLDKPPKPDDSAKRLF